MIAVLVFFICTISGAFFIAAFKGRKIQDYLPISNLSIIAVLYFFGLINMLETGVYVSLVIVGLLIVAGIWKCVRSNKMTRVCLFNGWTILFFLLFCSLIYTCYGMLAYGIDDLCHWMECIKSMTYINDFITNPASHATLKDYPPGMALIQYFVQKVYKYTHNDFYSFNEWLMYFVYQIHMISLFFPLISVIGLKKRETSVLLAVTFFLFPTYFFNYFYATITIDPFLAVIGGVSIGYACKLDLKDKLHISQLCLMCINLVLAKSPGIIFALIASFIILLRVCFENEKRLSYFFLSSTPLIFSLVAYKSWNIEVISSGARQLYQNKVSFINFFRLVFLHQGKTFEIEVLNHFGKLYISQSLPIVLVLSSLIILSLIVRWKAIGKKQRIEEVLIIAILIIQHIGYSLGVLALHLYNLSEYEARQMTSFERYMNIDLLAVTIVIVSISLPIFESINRRVYTLCSIVLTLFMFFLSDIKTIRIIISKENLVAPNELRRYMDELTQKIYRYCDGDDKIWYVARGDSGSHSGGYCMLFANMLRFTVEPNGVVVPFGGWGLGPPLSDEDIWYYDITCDEWINLLYEEQYEYVAIYYVGDEFVSNFGEAFECGDDIHNNSLYYFDRNIGKLVLCE